ncbi:hypothetical protein GOP47_0029347 [Adiantum capillus-veneris]|nr:hypothetical protein GOP47_0029347 [Adiantum capillus-veneris]
MRLTETVENLRMRAITDLKSGKEGSARQLIAEKQKVMQALEKSKQRAELLEELCNKLGEAISSKELQVIASLSSTVAVDDNSTTTLNVRIVSPKAENLAFDGVVATEETGDLSNDLIDSMDSLNDHDGEAARPHSGVDDATIETANPSTDAASAMLSSRVQMYPDFLLGIDNRLQEAEAQLHGFLNIATMVVSEDVDKITKERVTVVRQIWQDVLVARARIRKAVHLEDVFSTARKIIKSVQVSVL